MKNLAIGTITLLLFVVAVTATNPQPTKSRWMVKTSLPADPGPAKAVNLSELMGLGELSGYTEADFKPNGKYNEVRLPDNAPNSNPKLKEGQMITTTGYLDLVAYKTDDLDYHIQLTTEAADATHKPTECFIVELPEPSPDYVADTNLRQQFQTLRDWMNQKLFNGKPASKSGSPMQHTVYVQVTGQLFYDGYHEGASNDRGIKGCKVQSVWELHPITEIKFVPLPH